jgi:diacylglycerol O-acyltransferase-1
MLPIARDGSVNLKEGRHFKVFLDTLRMSVPAAYVWLAFFYMFFHAHMNLFAEITHFADRRFYSDWWNAGNLSEYWRKWNFPIHSFLIRHIYYPLRRRKVSKPVALLITFLISAVFHEYVIIGVFRVFNFIAFTIMIINVPLMILQNKLKLVSN